MIKPPNLQKGDAIAIEAPAGYLKSDESLKKGIALAELWGLRVELGTHIYKKEGHFAGTDAERLSDLQRALDNPSIKAIWCARGGYGTNRIIDNLDFTEFKKHPKWVIGFSDICVLLNRINNLGIETLHAMMPTSLKTIANELAVVSMHKALFGRSLKYKIPANKNNVLGQARGILVGGNLSLLAASLGTKSALKPKDVILFIEETGEYKYRIDRMLYSLKRNGFFEKCRGVLIGGMTDIPVNDPLFGKTMEQLILEVIGRTDIPICFDFPAGHIPENCSLIFGRKVSLKIDKEKSILIFK
ncbi:MAG: LD-carboxypeptidase [Flavobacteriaceae bacterium]|nr:LD-carboxypeptidase [Flavobacteriaceae bacterium]